MRVLVIGATGLIGSAVVARLIQLGHDVTAVSRDIGSARRRQPEARWLRVDIAREETPEHWLPHLQGIEALVNCAGALQDGPSDTLKGVHTDGIGALFVACEMLGIRRIVHFSAIGVDRETPTALSRTKLAGDQRLMNADLDWVILRPSVVLGRAVYGASALFRALAILPILPVLPNTGSLQVVQLEEVVRTVLHFLDPDSSRRVVLELAGPQRLSFTEIVQEYRRWLGYRSARLVHVPGWIASLIYGAGDLVGRLGWRPPVRSTARHEITRGAIGDPGLWQALTGISPQSLSAALSADPPAVQDRWFAGLYLLKPVIFTVFSLFWIGTGLLSVGPSFRIGVELMEVGEVGPWSAPSVIAGGIADLLIGIGIAVRRFTRPALYAALAISIFYLIAGTILLPKLWLDPLGPMMKIWPIMALNLVALAILRDR